MITYTVTVNVPSDLANDWCAWMLDAHIPDVLATGLWDDATMDEQMDQQPEHGRTFVIRYRTSSIERYEVYRSLHAPRLQADHAARYGTRVTASRTLTSSIATLHP
jgi:hypothetical protein